MKINAERLKCLKCGFEVCNPCLPMASNDNNFVQLQTDEVLRSPIYVDEMADRCVELNIPSRQLPTEIAKTVFEYDGAILNHVGMPYLIGVNDIDNAFRLKSKQVHGDKEDDLDWTPDFRWIRCFYKRANVPGKQTAQIRITSRLRLIHIFLEIKKQQTTKAKRSGGINS